MDVLTEKQRQALEYIEWRLRRNDPPSQREIGAHFGMAQNSVYQIVGYLEKKGYVVRGSGHRGIRLSAEYEAAAGREAAASEGVPLVGQVAAGEPILAAENIERYVDIRTLLGLSEDVFLLRVRGDSMIDDGIMDGDLVAVRPQHDVADGDIAVVLLDDEATVKRVYMRKDRIALKPANRRGGYKTRYIKRTEKEIRIIGVVTGCVRSMVR
ncbi:MAG TPA: transcriptional repressor LexA [Anaerohalosphaeraceae bacterium]|jgi:repressor LexA|nr:transcriptional repressor LexA [Anaerohalosphaeraceae bacterium]HRT49301.1 transcriptional repressor LexA [Anaerohalosphaeraceae bacterium]HRT85160.1 transcriptional repressor LexA [Anaerohalosphaeraceae bacterium]